MKKSLLILIGLVSVVVGWGVVTYPRVGAIVYEVGIATEAAVYGFEKRQQALGELEMVYYIGGNAEGPAIVMLHGYSADKMVWLRFAQHLSDDYHIIIPDLAGHGETGFASQWDYTMEAQAERVANLLSSLDIDQAHVIGNSMGGFIAAQFALMYPERTLSVTPVDPAGVPTPQPSKMEKMLAQGRNPFLVENAEQFTEFYHMTMAQPPWLPQMVLDAMAENYRARAPELDAIFADIQRSALLTDRLGDIESPALILWGDQDALIHVSGAQRWHELLPNSELTVWKGIGHMPMLEIPEDSARRYRKFLEGL